MKEPFDLNFDNWFSYFDSDSELCFGGLRNEDFDQQLKMNLIFLSLKHESFKGFLKLEKYKVKGNLWYLGQSVSVW